MMSIASTGRPGAACWYCSYCGEERERVSRLLAAVEHACLATEPHPPEPGPVLVVVVDEDRHIRPSVSVLDPP